MPACTPRSRRSICSLAQDRPITHADPVPSGRGLAPGQACAPLPGCATAPGQPQDNLPGTRPQRGRPVAGLALLCSENVAETGGILSPDPPRAQGGDKKAPAPPALASPIAAVAGRKADHGTGWVRAITGRLKKVPMFAQLSLYL